jgi:hypothetical protein
MIARRPARSLIWLVKLRTISVSAKPDLKSHWLGPRELLLHEFTRGRRSQLSSTKLQAMPLCSHTFNVLFSAFCKDCYPLKHTHVAIAREPSQSACQIPQNQKTRVCKHESSGKPTNKNTGNSLLKNQELFLLGPIAWRIEPRSQKLIESNSESTIRAERNR